MSEFKPAYLAIDLGVGTGAKLGLFDPELRLGPEGVVPSGQFGDDYGRLVSGIREKGEELLGGTGCPPESLSAIGLVAPGVQDAEGTTVGAAGFPFMLGKNLSSDLELEFRVPVASENDANAGGVAEWNSAREELLYWVLGGGWGGAWISPDGEVRFHTKEWNGKEEALHLTIEPGFATPIYLSEIPALFGKYDLDVDLWERNLAQEKPSSRFLVGDHQKRPAYRAETLVSGSGLHRFFRCAPECHNQIYRELWNPGEFGRKLDDLAASGDSLACRIYGALGEAMVLAGSRIIKRAVEDGAAPGIPIYLGGKPSRGFDFFAGPAQQGLDAAGLQSRLIRSKVELGGRNPNLLGAAVLARKKSRD